MDTYNSKCIALLNYKTYQAVGSQYEYISGPPEIFIWMDICMTNVHFPYPDSPTSTCNDVQQSTDYLMHWSSCGVTVYFKD